MELRRVAAQRQLTQSVVDSAVGDPRLEVGCVRVVGEEGGEVGALAPVGKVVVGDEGLRVLGPVVPDIPG